MFDMKHLLEDPVTATVAAVGALGGYSAYQEHEAAKDEKRARAAQRRQQAIKTSRERRRQIQEAQRLQAETEATGVATGTRMTSAVAQAQGGVQSQLAANLSFLDQMGELAERQSIFAQKTASHRLRSETAQQVASTTTRAATLFG